MKCKADLCDREVTKYKNLCVCHLHYSRLRKFGSLSKPLPPKTIKKESELTYKEASDHYHYCESTGKITLKIPSWGRIKGEEVGHTGKLGYRLISHRGFRFQGHRVAWLLHFGEWPNDNIDHVDGIKTNNKISNLRDVHQSHNARNAKTPKNNTSGYIGVYWSKRHGKWCAYIKFDYKKKHLGLFDDIQDVVKARKDAQDNLGFHENHGR